MARRRLVRGETGGGGGGGDSDVRGGAGGRMAPGVPGFERDFLGVSWPEGEAHGEEVGAVEVEGAAGDAVGDGVEGEGGLAVQVGGC